MKAKNQFNYLYDRDADVLYISKGKPSKNDFSDEIEDGVVARFDPNTKEIRGFTVLNFAARSQKKSEVLNLPFELTFNPVAY